MRSCARADRKAESDRKVVWRLVLRSASDRKVVPRALDLDIGDVSLGLSLVGLDVDLDLDWVL